MLNTDKINQNLIPIIIPSYEPNENLLNLLDNLVKENMKKIIIVDDGSDVALYSKFFTEAKEKYHAEVLRHNVNKGKGVALKTAFKYCIDTIPDLIGVVTADSDGQHLPSCIENCIRALNSNPTKLVMGVRDFTLPNVPKNSYIGNTYTNKIINTIHHSNLTDTQTGLRGIPKQFMIDCMKLKGERFEYEIQMVSLALTKKVEVFEVPIQTIYDSKENHATHFRPFVDTVKLYHALGLGRSLRIILFK